MKRHQIIDLLTASFGSLNKEGKFARKLLWKHARPAVVQEVYSELSSFVSKFIRIAAVGLFLSFFQESTFLVWLKANYIPAIAVFIIYSLLDKMIYALMSSAREKCQSVIMLEIKSMIWYKNNSVGIGTRMDSQFRQKLRTAGRCGYYDIKQVGLWPIEAFAAIVSSFAFIGTLTFLNWRIGVIFITTSCLTALVGAYMARWVRDREKQLQEADERAYEYLPAALSVDSTFLGTSLALFKRGRSLMEVLIAEKVRFHRTSLLVTTLIGSLTLLAVAIQLYIARDGLFRDASLFKIGLTVSTLSAAIGSVSSAVRAFFGDQSAIADVREFLEFLDFPDTEKGRKDASFVMDPRDSVRVADAKFAYPYVTNAPLVLNGVSLEFVPGEAVALVGANGSGKTTLSCLLTNTHRPKEGCVMHGATPIGDYTARSVLEHTLVVPQSGDLPDIPLCESLFGVTDMVYIDKERYLRAIAMSGAREVLDRLPNGIHTLIGTQFTGGTNLSGGEEQRLRLAGFLYRTLDPLIRFVIADEPSRHLDPATRRRVYDELIALARNSGKIVIVISHDADLLKFDRVVLLDDGRVYGDYRGEAISEAVNLVSQRLVDDAVRD